MFALKLKNYNSQPAYSARLTPLGQILFKTKERWGWLTSKLSSDSLSLEKSLLRLFYTSYRLVDIKN